MEAQLRDVRAVQSSHAAFAAITGGGVVAWGAPEKGGDCRAVADRLVDVVAIQSTRSAFAALTAQGTVVAWGCPQSGGDASGAAFSAPPRGV